jgi:hypothetical protein
MGNTTKARMTAPQVVHNAIAKRLRVIHNEANVHQRALIRLGNKINSGSYNERDMIKYEVLSRRIRELIREKNSLERTQRRFY